MYAAYLIAPLWSFLFIMKQIHFSFVLFSCLVLVGVFIIGTQPSWFDRTSENVLGAGKEISASLVTPENTYEVVVPQGSTVLDAMYAAQKEHEFSFKGKEFSGIGFFVEEIEGIRQDPLNKMYWIYYVNKEKAQVGVSSYIIQDNDVITFKYEEME